MPLQIAAILIALGCAPAPFDGPTTGKFVVWVCPPLIEAPAEPTEPERPRPEERPT